MSPSSQEIEPNRAEVIQQLEKVFADRRFAAAGRNANFLRYIVNKSLDGEAGQIKEIVIATEVYGRPGDYDPKTDSIVRVEANRLRSKLNSYYQQEGSLDSIRITVPTGGYVPRFERMLPRSPEVPSLPEIPPAPIAGSHSAPRRSIPSLAVVMAVALVAALGWSRTVRNAEGVYVPHPEALAAWQLGNDLLRQDPHTASSERGAPQVLLRAIENYEIAVAKDPSFASAWASLAEAYDYAFPFVGRDRSEDRRRAEAAAQRAVSLDDRSSPAHAMLALVQFCLKWDFKAAEKSYRTAIALNARNTQAIVEYADLLRETNRVEQAAQEVRKARSLQPAIAILAVKESEIHLDQNRPAAAIAAASEALQMSNFARGHLALGMALERNGEPARALTHYQNALAFNRKDRRVLPAYGYLLARMGRREEALAVIRQLEEIDSRTRYAGFQIAMVYAGLNQPDMALHWLERAWAVQQSHLPFAAVEYRFRPLHREPRFQAILNRLGLRPVIH